MGEVVQARWVWGGSLSDLTGIVVESRMARQIDLELLNLLDTERHWAVLLVVGI